MFTKHAVALVLSLVPSHALAAWLEDHLDVVDEMVADISPLNNEYGSPSSISYTGGVVTVFAECGGFVAQLLQLTYDVLDDPLMSGLFDDDPGDSKPWASPDSTHFYRAIVTQRTALGALGRYQVMRRHTVAEIAAGDILAAEYADAGATGHTMLVREVRGAPLEVASTIPGRTRLLRYSVQVIDASATVHMNKRMAPPTRATRPSRARPGSSTTGASVAAISTCMQISAPGR